MMAQASSDVVIEETSLQSSLTLNRRHHHRREKIIHQGYSEEERRDARREAAKAFFLGIPLDSDIELTGSTHYNVPVSRRLSTNTATLNEAPSTRTSTSIEPSFLRDSMPVDSPRRSKRRKSHAKKPSYGNNLPYQSACTLESYINDPQNKRIAFMYNSNPVTLYSLIPYNKPTKKVEYGTGRVRTNSISTQMELDDIGDIWDPNTEISLACLLEPLWTSIHSPSTNIKTTGLLLHQSSFREGLTPPLQDTKHYPWHFFRDNHTPHVVMTKYHPECLDNSKYFLGRHVTTLNLSSYRVSLVRYARETDVKKEINKEFGDMFPHIKLTYSKLKSIKKDIISLGFDCGLDAVTTAHALVYFDKLTLMGKINKSTRKFVAGACVLLATKFTTDMKRQNIKNLIDEITDKFKLSQKELLSYEFPTLLALDFSLLTPTDQLKPLTDKISFLEKNN